MEIFNEAEIAKSYEGKHYNLENLSKIARPSGDTRAIIYYGRLGKKQFELFEITTAILHHWVDNSIFYSVVIDLDETSNTIKQCHIAKNNKDERLTPTQQEILIFKRIMDYVTASNTEN